MHWTRFLWTVIFTLNLNCIYEILYVHSSIMRLIWLYTPLVCRCSPSGIKAAEDHGGEAVQSLCFCWCDEQWGASGSGWLSGSKHLHAEDTRWHPKGWCETSHVASIKNIVWRNFKVFVCLPTGLHSSLQPETAGFGWEAHLPHLWRPQVRWHWKHSEASVRRCGD